MANYSVFDEDEDDIFSGSPKSKFLDIIKQSSDDIVKEELDKIIEKLAILELIVSEKKDENFDINQEIKEYLFNNMQKVEEMKKGLYMEFSGEIIQRLDS
ncbi:MAG: DUF2018 family protein [Arcobacter sp.]|nr:DUF2018 family protein [Arcobacter sp.]